MSTILSCFPPEIETLEPEVRKYSVRKRPCLLENTLKVMFCLDPPFQIPLWGTVKYTNKVQKLAVTCDGVTEPEKGFPSIARDFSFLLVRDFLL